MGSELSALACGQVLDVGRATLLVEPITGDGEPVLGAQEHAHLGELRSPLRRREWLAGRRAAKSVLQARFGLLPAEVQVLPDEGGRPRVHLSGGVHPAFWLSISHTRSYAAAACGEAELGVDVCDLEDGHRLDRIVGRVFSPGEAEAAGALLTPERRAVSWALKEACLKATGGGVFDPGTRSIRLHSAVPPRVAVPGLEVHAWSLPGAVVTLALSLPARPPPREGG